MLPISTKDRVVFTPSAAEKLDPQPKIWLKVPSHLDRIDFRRAVTARGGRYPTNGQMLDVIREGIRELIDEDQIPDLLEIVDHYQLAVDASETPDTKLAENFERIEREVRQYYPRYAAMEADRSHWLNVGAYVAAKLFIADWENMPVEYKRRPDGVPDSLLAKLPESYVIETGFHAISLMNMTDSQVKNSDSPSSLPADPETSPAAS